MTVCLRLHHISRPLVLFTPNFGHHKPTLLGGSRLLSWLKMDKKPEGKSDEELRKVLKPNPRQDQVLEILKKSFAKNGASVKLLADLDSYDDRNYKVEIDGTIYLLKINNGVESLDYMNTIKAAGGDYYLAGHMNSSIHFQNALIDVLSKHNIPTSTLTTPTFGRSDVTPPPVALYKLPVVSVEHSPCYLAVRLLKWIEGRTMSSIKLLPLETLADAGRWLGRVDKALDTMLPNAKPFAAFRRRESQGVIIPPRKQLDTNDPKFEYLQDSSLLAAARKFHQWDGKNTVQIREYTHCITNEKRRGLVEDIIDTFERDIIKSGQGAKFRIGILHGDYNDANVMLNDDLQVSGVIDFGDSIESWRVLDVSIAMAYGMLSSYGKANRSISAAAAVLRGFNSVYHLTDVERKHLVLLMASRLACSVTLGAYSFQQNPENHYLLFHAEPAWKALELIWSYDSERRAAVAHAVNRVFHQACLYTEARDKIITCSDLVLPDPGVADLMQSVRVPSFDFVEPPQKKHKTEPNGKPIITFVTGNAKKLEEVKRILRMDDSVDEDARLPYVMANEKIDLPELQGNPISVAQDKCKAAVEKLGAAVIVEDTSLCFNALNGLPGVYIKWFLESCGHDGLNKMIEAYDDKSAYAQTVVAFCPGPGKEVAIFDGQTAGKIVMPRGSLAFGWDPIFEPTEGGGKTYGEMNKEEKDAISQRSRAFLQLREYLDKFRGEVLKELH